MPAATSATLVMNARWNPDSSASTLFAPAANSWSVRLVASVASTAMPSAPPNCPVVFTSPEARPESLGATSAMASVFRRGKDRPAPTPSRIIDGSKSTTYVPSTGTRMSQASPAVIIVRPVRSIVRPPKRMFSRGATRNHTVAIPSAAGRKARPISSG